MDRFGLYCLAFGVEAAFALALWGLAWLNAKASATVRIWSAALTLSWGATELPAWFGLSGFETFTVLSDVALGIAAAFDFCFDWRNEGSRRPLWLVGVLTAYIAQLMFHLNDDSDKALEINVAFAAQIALVGSEQVLQRLRVMAGPHVRTLRYSTGRASVYDRRLTCWLGGPCCRASALRRASEQARR